jgi:hypothetical protein
LEFNANDKVVFSEKTDAGTSQRDILGVFKPSVETLILVFE